MPPLDEDNDNDNDNDDEGIPQFPLPGSIQRANPVAAAPSFDVSPPSPPASDSSSRPSTPPTPKARPSHRAFPPEGDDVLQGLSLPLPPSTKSIPPKVRRKEALKPGHSALDWARASREGGEDFRAGFEFPNQRITLSEVAEHKRKNDAWSVFHGKVYNITPYLDYHPGGVSQLMKCAGKDGTELFMKTHGWVNAELMMESCMIGFLVREPSANNPSSRLGV